MPNAPLRKMESCFGGSKAYSEMYSLPPDLTMEQRAISLRIAAALLRYAEAGNLGQVLHTPGGLLLSKRTIRPDVLFIAQNRSGIVGRRGLHAPPDLIVDILSPRRQERAFAIKKRLYAFFEIREYWVADPDTASIEVLLWSEVGYVPLGRYGPAGRVFSPLLPDLELRVSSVFPKKAT